MVKAIMSIAAQFNRKEKDFVGGGGVFSLSRKSTARGLFKIRFRVQHDTSFPRHSELDSESQIRPRIQYDDKEMGHPELSSGSSIFCHSELDSESQIRPQVQHDASFPRHPESPTRHPESSLGRSMLEILGVLALMAVLSIVGLFGFRVAMNYYKANETIHDVMLRATNVPMMWDDYDTNSNYLNPFEFMFADLKTTNRVGYPVHTMGEPNNSPFVFRVEVSNVSEEVCKRILGLKPTDVDLIEVGAHGFTPTRTTEAVQENCAAAGLMIFFFDNLWRDQPSSCARNADCANGYKCCSGVCKASCETPDPETPCDCSDKPDLCSTCIKESATVCYWETCDNVTESCWQVSAGTYRCCPNPVASCSEGQTTIKDANGCPISCEEACTTTADCTGAQVCKAGVCVPPECTTSADCTGEQVCKAGICVTPECTTSADCTGEQVCKAGICVPPECTTTADCTGEQVCKAGVCVPPECTTSADCTGEQVCKAGVCVTPECTTSTDCTGERVCTAGVCVPPECTTSADCTGEQVCKAGVCVTPECTTTADCTGEQVCKAGICVTPECTTDTQCTGAGECCRYGLCTTDCTKCEGSVDPCCGKEALKCLECQVPDSTCSECVFDVENPDCQGPCTDGCPIWTGSELSWSCCDEPGRCWSRYMGDVADEGYAHPELGPRIVYNEREYPAFLVCCPSNQSPYIIEQKGLKTTINGCCPEGQVAKNPKGWTSSNQICCPSGSSAYATGTSTASCCSGTVYKSGENSYGCCPSGSEVNNVQGASITGLQKCCDIATYGANTEAYEFSGETYCCPGVPYQRPSDGAYECCMGDNKLISVTGGSAGQVYCCGAGRQSAYLNSNGTSVTCCDSDVMVSGDTYACCTSSAGYYFIGGRWPSSACPNGTQAYCNIGGAPSACPSGGFLFCCKAGYLLCGDNSSSCCSCCPGTEGCENPQCGTSGDAHVKPTGGLCP